MKTNEAPKSKFVYPDKLYARCKDNKTLDMSYAPQTLEAVEYSRTDVFIEKALRWMISQGGVNDALSKEMIDDFRKYIEGE